GFPDRRTPAGTRAPDGRPAAGPGALATAILLGLAALLAAVPAGGPPSGDPLAELRRIPILSGGRAKPLEAHAREWIARSRPPAGTPSDPVEAFLQWTLEPHAAGARPPFPAVPHAPGPDGTCSVCRRLLPELDEGALEAASSRWFDPADPPDGPLLEAHLPAGRLAALRGSLERLQTALRERGDPAGACTALKSSLEAIGYPAHLVDTRRLDLEVRYLRLHPFRWAWTAAALGALLLAIPRRPAAAAGILALAASLAFAGLGFALRTILSGRAPVTNMYESVVWAGAAALLFGLAFGAARRRIAPMFAGAVAAAATLALADASPAILAPSIRPLTAILRSNFWLTVHVVTIMLAYAVFMVALVAGHRTLLTLRRRPADASAISEGADLLHRLLLLGVLLLAAGTLLGAAWGYVAWGRFWGWDPKENWAAITLLVYLVPLHARRAGLLSPFGLAVASIACFQALVMAWYGVNFVLGRGLHAYGFAAGGHLAVGAFVLVEAAVLVTAFFLQRKNSALDLRVEV
ncbi:MAG: cytochrome c biogenesis protein CcsA, partial [Planctomycetota bacterium]